ncbi:MAG TPA: glycosyltransferase family 39 protein [Patescibacteria group bacterium]|nr:glycosyltransferase family 39 protein [Patescibacteria group bacterium]
MIKKYKNLILVAIIVLAFVLRFWQLNNYPALNADEASNGYDAYSLLLTGKDQHGNSWPIDFQSFNDYKPGLYVYLIMPFVKILGLNEWAVRIPGAFVGVISVYLIYLLVKELFKRDGVALVSAFFLSISPWHIQFSRGGWEVNVATFLITAGVLFWLKYFNGNQRKLWQLILSIILFVLSMYCYQATRVVTPLVGIGLVVIYWKQIWKNLSHVMTVIVLGIVLLLPLLLDFTHGGVLNRAAGVGLFADPGPRSRVEEQRGEHGADSNSFIVKALHNKVVNYTLAFAENWMSHFHGEFLFLSGDSVTRNKVPETGEFYLTDIVFLTIGGVIILRTLKKKETQILVMWIIVGPIASALTFQAPSALRAENIVIPLVIISAQGAIGLGIYLYKLLQNKILFKISILFIFALVIWGFARYEQMYWNHMSKEYPYSSQYGVKELVSYIEQSQDKYSKILVTDRYDQPYILFLFYMKYPPAKFQPQSTLGPKDQYGFSTVNHFDKYYFASIDFEKAKTENPNSLIAGTADEIPKEANIVKDVYGTNGFLYFRVVAN